MHFTKAFIYFFLLVISISYADTQEEQAAKDNNTRVSIYLHPAYSYYFSNIDITAIYFTIEIPFGLPNSLIIKPSFLRDNYDGAFRLGSDIGFRHYLFENGEGLYLQGQMGIFYNKRNDYYDVSSRSPLDLLHSKSLWLNPTGYVGYSLKYSHINIFIDAGLGGVMGISTKTGQVTLSDEPWPDFEIGIGIHLGVAKLANTQEEQMAKIANLRTSVYLHPFSTFLGLIGFSPIYLTAEIPFSLYNSLIIRPSFLDISHIDGDKAFRVGSDIGLRHYLAGNGEGLYLQGQMGIFYFRNNNHYIHDEECGSEEANKNPFYRIYNIPKKALWLDAMGYIGYSLKFSNISIFIDAGFGPALGINHRHIKLFDDLWSDLNIGIGIPF